MDTKNLNNYRQFVNIAKVDAAWDPNFLTFTINCRQFLISRAYL